MPDPTVSAYPSARRDERSISTIYQSREPVRVRWSVWERLKLSY